VLLGETLSFAATISNTSNTAVTWSVNGVVGGSTQNGTISPDGIYTAPVDLPPLATVSVIAASQADPAESATAGVTIISDIAISVSPGAANVELGARQNFQATIQSQGRPDPTIRWSLSGGGCPSICGTVDASGSYMAPQILPNPVALNLTATSVADPSKQSTAKLTITSHFTLQLSAPASLAPGATSPLVAVLTPVAGSNPSEALSWSVSGSGCLGSACGVLTVTTTQSAGGASLDNTAVYTAPLTQPEPDNVLVTVTPFADPSKQAQANITIQGSSGIGISPASATLAVNGRITFTALQSGASGEFNWSVNGVPGGNSTYGQICVTGSSPCQPFMSGTATQVDYSAPGSVPSPNPLVITVSSSSNPSLSSSAEITVINHVVVSVLPSSATLPPLGTQSFSATVLGTIDQGVVWQVQGTGCGTVGSCGTVDSSGNYTAPGISPSPNSLHVVATSQYDSTQSGNANVTISTQLNIIALHPASVYAGGLDGFTLQVDGSGFLPSGGDTGSTLLIGGTARATTCTSAGVCTAAVTSADVAQAGNLTIQVQNPDAVMSNVVYLVVLAPSTLNDVISLNVGAPAATGEDIIVVEPTTAGIDTADDDLDLNIEAIGVFAISDDTCSLGGNAIPLILPSSGSGTVGICLFSESGLNSSMTYTVSGPGDVVVISQQPAGLGMIQLALQIPFTAATGARTLFIQNSNLDETSASGVLQVQ
jgi:hypothetical protein